MHEEGINIFTPKKKKKTGRASAIGEYTGKKILSASKKNRDLTAADLVKDKEVNRR